jgi:hypothetical protein
MKRISRESVKKVTSLIGESGLLTMIVSKGALFFPVETPEKSSESETGVILVEARKDGSAALVKPGLILSIGENESIPTVFFGYATTEYAVNFDTAEYHLLTGDKGFLTNEEAAELEGYECLVVKKDSILVAFEVGADISISNK